MTCPVREFHKRNKTQSFRRFFTFSDLKKGSCNISQVGEDTGGDVFWCSSCGILVSGSEEICIPLFDNQDGGPA